MPPREKKGFAPTVSRTDLFHNMEERKPLPTPKGRGRKREKREKRGPLLGSGAHTPQRSVGPLLRPRREGGKFAAMQGFRA